MPNEVPAGRCTVLVLSASLSVVGCTRRPAAAAPPPTSPPPLQQRQDDSAAIGVDARADAREWQNRSRSRDRQRTDSPPPTGAHEQVVARVSGREITLRELQEPLIEGYGLTVLLNLVQLELAREAAERVDATVTADDVAAERQRTLAKLFPDAEESEYEALFEQFLQQQRITRPEFDLVLQTNAHLRRVIEPQVRGKVTEENLKEAFNQTYGESVQVRHIQLTNMADVAEAKRRLGEGEAFEKVAQEMSQNPRTGVLGGELPPFSRAATAYPQAFRDAAFTLQPGEVSDPVQADGWYHIIKLDQRIQPRAVKFEDVKESLRADLEERLIQAGMNQLRNEIGQEALRTLKVEHPVLREQYQRRLENRDAQVKDQNQARQELEKYYERLRQRQRELDEAATRPASPATQPGAERAPATAPAPTEPGAPTTEP